MERRVDHFVGGDTLRKITSWDETRNIRYESYVLGNTNRSRESGTLERREPGTLRNSHAIDLIEFD